VRQTLASSTDASLSLAQIPSEEPSETRNVKLPVQAKKDGPNGHGVGTSSKRFKEVKRVKKLK
jgi:hypothetical protein